MFNTTHHASQATQHNTTQHNLRNLQLTKFTQYHKANYFKSFTIPTVRAYAVGNTHPTSLGVLVLPLISLEKESNKNVFTISIFCASGARYIQTFLMTQLTCISVSFSVLKKSTTLQFNALHFTSLICPARKLPVYQNPMYVVCT